MSAFLGFPSRCFEREGPGAEAGFLLDPGPALGDEVFDSQGWFGWVAGDFKVERPSSGPVFVTQRGKRLASYTLIIDSRGLGSLIREPDQKITLRTVASSQHAAQTLKKVFLRGRELVFPGCRNDAGFHVTLIGTRTA